MSSNVRPLRHFTKRGRVRNWELGKHRSLAIARAYEWLGMLDMASRDDDPHGHLRRAQRIADCGSRLDFTVDEDKRLTLYNGRRCKARLCVLCQQVTARRAFAQLHELAKLHAAAHPRAMPALLTLTIPNVDTWELAGAISSMVAGFRKMRKMKAFTNAIIGWRRALEVTLNPKTGQFHPHFHVLVFFAPDYGPTSNTYLTQPQFQAMWERALGVPLAIVDIRRIKAHVKDGKLVVGDNDGIAEVAKYIVKPHELFVVEDDEYRIDETVLAALHQGLKHRRIYDFGGTLRALRPAEREIKAEAAIRLVSYLWTELTDAYGNVHGTNYWPVEALTQPAESDAWTEFGDGERPRIRDPPDAAEYPVETPPRQTQKG